MGLRGMVYRQGHGRTASEGGFWYCNAGLAFQERGLGAIALCGGSAPPPPRALAARGQWHGVGVCKGVDEKERAGSGGTVSYTRSMGADGFTAGMY